MAASPGQLISTPERRNPNNLIKPIILLFSEISKKITVTNIRENLTPSPGDAL